MAVGVVDVQIVEYQNAAGFQRCRDVVQHRHMLRRLLEVAEAGEQTEDVVELIAAKRQSHVLSRESQIATVAAHAAPRLRDTLRREIEPRDVEPARRELPRMSSCPTPKIERTCT